MSTQRQEKDRLDRLLVQRGLVDSRQKAQALILAGQVLVDEQKVEKCGAAVNASARLRLLGEASKYVGRGGLKLEAALDHFGVDPGGKVCLDVGASTGGFTDCLLQRGAVKVFAVDAGTNQLDWKLRQDPRVVVLEKTNARYLAFEQIGTRVALATLDVSFISSTLILPLLPPLLEEGAELLSLVKPQFEVGPAQVGKGGVVRDARLHEEAIAKVARKVAELGFTEIARVESALLGAEGNREFFLHAIWPKNV
ncbi:MAG TPA: TlyA family RNA methyltransferase [Terriglobia bacterium]|nr:TlyA family RNA methyltransferase [Terriglobia bacterium]